MEPRSKKARFGEVSEDAELQALDARTPMSTKTTTTYWLGVFESFCVEKEIVPDLNRFLVGGKITINRHKAVHTFLDNMFRSVSLQVQYKDTVRTNLQLNFKDLGI